MTHTFYVYQCERYLPPSSIGDDLLVVDRRTTELLDIAANREKRLFSMDRSLCDFYSSHPPLRQSDARRVLHEPSTKTNKTKELCDLLLSKNPTINGKSFIADSGNRHTPYFRFNAKPLAGGGFNT